VTETEWLTAEDPGTLPYEFLKQFNDRKLRLAAVAACRTVAHLLCDRGRQSLEVAERYAESQVWREECAAAEQAVQALIPVEAFSAYGAVSWAFASYPASQVMQMACLNAIAAGGFPPARYAHLLRDILGNPFRQAPVIDISWRTPAVLALATTIYNDQSFGDIPVLADALEEADCDEREWLAHLRGGGPHWRGCYVLDALLGKG
jgi:hypothetical protein